MLILCVSCCTDPFSHTPMKAHTVRTGMECSKRELELVIRDYEVSLKNGHFSRIHIHLIDINPDDGEVTVLINRVGENPLKTKKIINPAALAVREARLARAKERFGKYPNTIAPSILAEHLPSAPPQTVPMFGDVLIDEVGAAQ